MQNHMFMLLALIAMEPPTSLEGEAIRNALVICFRSLDRHADDEKPIDS
ncbi:MAG: hypothetical protein JO151_06035 [Verrucomicrobia bacterium]|jgi:glucose-6-phosphate 1-dehydrogenase|nr:hypothetical protein [Verrucomicrobiota bacterium]